MQRLIDFPSITLLSPSLQRNRVSYRVTKTPSFLRKFGHLFEVREVSGDLEFLFILAACHIFELWRILLVCLHNSTNIIDF